MSVSQVATVVENDHAIVFLKTDDNEVHALEFGEHHADADAKHTHGHHNEHLHGPHSEGKKHEHGEHHEHAQFGKAYGIHLYSPITTRPTQLTLPTAWKSVNVKITPDELNHTLKNEWHTHKGSQFFHDASTFAAHVVSQRLNA